MNILIVTGSARKQNAGANVLRAVQKAIGNVANVSVADLKQLNLPMLDTEIIPANEAFDPEYEPVKKFTSMVEESDVVIFLTPQYNKSYSAVTKNAIDWVYGPWQNKPVGFVGYSWGGAPDAIAHLKQVMGHLNAKPLETDINLAFTKDIELDGTEIASKVQDKVQALLKQLPHPSLASA